MTPGLAMKLVRLSQCRFARADFGRSGFLVELDLDTGTDPLLSLHDHTIAWLKPRFDDTQRSITTTNRDISPFDLLLGRDNVNVALSLLLCQGPLGNQ